jgi:hypothetical protein
MFQTQKGSYKENLKDKENSDRGLVQGKHDKENNVCDDNAQDCTAENPEMEKELSNDKNGIIEQEDGTSVCTEEWRDWSLELTGHSSLVITGKTDK